jgi:O-methyltransferase
MLKAEVRSVTGDMAYHPSDQWFEEFLELKRFFRMAFQTLVFNGIEGDYAEFGCCGGRTFRLAWGAARLVGHPAHLWAFDSFEGLAVSDDPRDEHPKWAPGIMAMGEADFREACLGHGMPGDSFTTVPGWYADTLGSSAPGPRPERISLAYIDCDLYTSAAEVMRFLGPYLRNGMILGFDDYYCYAPSAPSGERLAAGEYFSSSDRWQLLPYVQFGWHGMSFVVEERVAGGTGVPGW